MNKKSYLGILAIAAGMMGAMAVSSCSHDDYYYSPEKAEKAVNETYAAAFEKAFGKVGSNVDWGFSDKRANARFVTRAGEGFETTIEFPGDCDASKFLEEVPAGVSKLPTDGGGAGNYFIDETTTEVHTHAGKSNIYVTGTVDLSADDTNAQSFKFGPSITSEIYLLKGATLKLGEQSAINFNVYAIYIAEGATLETAGLLKANSSTKVYNHGTIKAGTFEVNTSSFLYNVGKLEAESVNVESNYSKVVNDGSISSETVVVNAGAVQNNAEWTVNGTTKINSNNSGWINNSHWITKDFAYVGGSENVITNCLLEVTNDFEMNISSANGSFKINTGGGVLTKNFYGGRDSSTGAISGPFKIEMGSNVVFKVQETAQFESGRQNINDDYAFGIFGPTSGDYSVFQAKNIVRAESLASTWGAVTYRGNLYVSAETHFAQGDDGYAPHKFIFAQDGFSINDNIYAPGFNSSGTPSINIDETPCCPGFGGDPVYRVIAEDLSATEASDFDFNDVVFDVLEAKNGQTTLKLICAGGVLPLRVRGANEAEGKEVHQLFGGSPNAKGEYQMYNTGAGPTVPPVEFQVEGEYTTRAQIKNIIIEVFKNETWMELKATTGVAACKILVDDTFVPVRERRNIADENLLFTDYISGAFVDDFWWKK